MILNNYWILLVRQEALIAIWNDGKTERQLRKLIHQNTTHPFTQLKAAEILFHYQKKINPEYYTTLAKAYAYSLAHSSFDQESPTLLNGNAWGLLYEEEDLGVLGNRFLLFDTAAITPLVRLLNDTNGRILYEGSQEATIGNGYQFRIKDFAAFYLSKITATPIIFHPQNINKRDQAIQVFLSKFMSPRNALEDHLDTTSYTTLFLYTDQSTLDSIWQDGQSKKALFQIITHPRTYYFTKLKAAEILLHYKIFLPEETYPTLAHVYTQALAYSSFEKSNYNNISGNAWGLLYESDHVGILGSRLLLLDTFATLPLINLLNDSDAQILYEGSKEATMGNSYHYRVKDIAAFYLSKIHVIPITFYPKDLKKREEEIEKLWRTIHY